MALIPGTITVDFISNYAGPHRICWRMGPSGPYNCTTIVTCLGGGNPCSGVINVMVDNETCDPVDFNGYVQAACQVDGSLVDRIPFQSIFIPNQACKGYTLRCESSYIESVTVTNPGSGYNPLSPPLVTINPGPGVGATATSEVGDGGILTQTITTGGAGYVNGTYINVPAVTLTGTGSGATYTVIVAGGVVTSITLTDPITAAIVAGTGYAIGDTFEFNNANLGGSGAGVVVTVDTLNTGMITFINMVLNGSGYIAVPSATVPPPGAGTQALLLAVFGGCANYNAGNNCDASVKPNIKLNINEETIVCNPITPPTPENPLVGVTITQDACCYDCTTVTVSKGPADGNAILIFTDCVTRNLIKVSITNNFSDTACIVTGSLLIQELTGGTTSVITGAACS